MKKIKPMQLLAEMTRYKTAIDARKPIIVFGQTPGVVTSVTVSISGNLMLEYRPLTSKEMSGK